MLLALVVVVVVTSIAIAMIRISSRELSGSIASRQNEALVSCAEAGRQLLMSQFRTAGVSPSSLTLNTPIDGTTGSTYAVGGHMDTTVESVTLLPTNSFGIQRSQVRDLTNIVAGAASLGGSPYRIIVHCEDRRSGTGANARQLEVEFGMRFGL